MGCLRRPTSRKLLVAMVNKNDTTLFQIAYRVRELRELRLLSQDDFARLADCHRSQISQVERGIKNVSVDTVDRIAKALDVDAFSLMQNEAVVARSPHETQSLRERVSRNVMLLRACRGLAQDALSECAGLSRNYVSNLEVHKKNVSVSHLERLAAVLEVPLSTLFQRDSPVGERVGRSS